MGMRNFGRRLKDHVIPFLGEPKAELLVFHAGCRKDRIKPIVLQKLFAAVRGGIGINKVDARQIEHRMRLLRRSVDVHTWHSQPMRGTPTDVPVPRKVMRKEAEAFYTPTAG